MQEGRDDLADLREGEMVEALTISSSEQTTLNGPPSRYSAAHADCRGQLLSVVFCEVEVSLTDWWVAAYRISKYGMDLLKEQATSSHHGEYQALMDPINRFLCSPGQSLSEMSLLEVFFLEEGCGEFELRAQNGA